MKRTIVILILVAALCLGAGCGTRKADVDMSDGGAALDPSPAAAKTEAAGNADTEPEPSPEPAPEEEQAPPAQEPVTLRYEGESAAACVDSIYFDQDGRLAVVVAGQGYAFNKVLPIRNGKIVVPFYADIRTGGQTHSWDTASFGDGAITYLFNVKQLPEEVILYSADNRDEQFVFDAAPYIRAEAPAPEQQKEDGAGLAELAGHWTGTGRPVGGGTEIYLEIDLKADGSGTYHFKQGDYSESYPISVNEGDGSFTADIPSDNYLGIASCKGTYVFDGSVLKLHIITEFASGGRFEYNVDCERAD